MFSAKLQEFDVLKEKVGILSRKLHDLAGYYLFESVLFII